MIRAVLFDLFETLITESASRRPPVSALASILGLDRDAFRREWKRRRHDVSVGRMSFRDALREVVAAQGGSVDPATLDALEAARRQAMQIAYHPLDADVLTTVAALRRRGVALAVVSNCFAEDVVAWPGCELAPLFEAALFSYDVGVAKPAPEIYHLACRMLEVPVEAALFLGDGRSDELAGARRAGLTAYQAAWFLRRWPHHDPRNLEDSAITDVARVLDLLDA